MRDKIIMLITILAFIFGCTLVYNMTKKQPTTQTKLKTVNHIDDKTCYIVTSYGHVGEDYKNNTKKGSKCYGKDKLTLKIEADSLALTIYQNKLLLTLNSKTIELQDAADKTIVSFENIYKDALDDIVMHFKTSNQDNGHLLLIFYNQKLVYNLSNVGLEINNDGNEILYKEYTTLGLNGVKKCTEYQDKNATMWTKGQVVYKDNKFVKNKIMTENVKDVCTE